MGCNCKQNTVSNNSKVKTPATIKVAGTPTLNYTREELIRVNDFFISRNKSANEENWVIDFHNKHFPEKFPYGYKGDGWLRIKNRINHLSQQLTNLENSQKTN